MKQLAFPFLMVLLCLSTALSAQKTNIAQIRPTLNHIAVYVYDLQKQADFYHQVMYLDTIPEPFHDGRHVWFRIGPHSQLHLIQGAKMIVRHDINTHICFAVPNLQAFMEHLNQLGVAYQSWTGERHGITKRQDGVQQIYLQDTEGNWIEVNDDRF
ncbi:VOC family protein [Hydrotalea flava]|uniref:VOC family protein n=1 Tax=Hydrotalea flava TaxID=714549 RepID=UPI0008309F9B|nr:VOC family protein [Hydrotalea flava]